jgi:hypothetical protein
LAAQLGARSARTSWRPVRRRLQRITGGGCRSRFRLGGRPAGRSFNGRALTIVLLAVFFYGVYLVVRAAVRDGIRLAGGQDLDASPEARRRT